MAGGAAGLWLSTLATDALLTAMRPVIPVAVASTAMDPDWRVLVGTIVFCVGATLIFGGWPAWTQTRRAAATDLKRHSGDEGRRPGGVRIGNALVIGQIALSVMLLASGGLFLMSVIRAATADPGFRLDGGVIVQVDPAPATTSARAAAHLALIDRLRNLPAWKR